MSAAPSHKGDKMKNLVKLLGLIILVAAPCYAASVNVDSDQSKGKLTSAFGDAKFSKDFANTVCSYKDTVLSSTELDALNATPQVLVPAPGAGKSLYFCGVSAWLNYGGTAWAGSSETLVLKSGTAGATLATLPETTFVELTRDAVMHAAASNTPYEVQENTAIYATANADWTTGNSPISLRVYYKTIGSSLILE